MEPLRASTHAGNSHTMISHTRVRTVVKQIPPLVHTSFPCFKLFLIFPQTKVQRKTIQFTADILTAAKHEFFSHTLNSHSHSFSELSSSHPHSTLSYPRNTLHMKTVERASDINSQKQAWAAQRLHCCSSSQDSWHFFLFTASFQDGCNKISLPNQVCSRWCSRFSNFLESFSVVVVGGCWFYTTKCCWKMGFGMHLSTVVTLILAQ